LYHWDLPQTLHERGGWANRDVASYFADYAEYICKRFGDRVQTIATHNEPWVVATMGYESGFYAPGTKDRKTASQVAHHLLLSHGMALSAMRAAGSQAKLGIVLNQGPMYPATEAPEDIALAKLQDGLLTRWYMDPLFRGEYPADVLAHLGDDVPLVKSGDFDIIRAPMDFLGVNYYSRGVISHDGSLREPSPLGFTDMGWEVYPQGLVDLLVRLNQEYVLPPIYITENGAAYPDDLDGAAVHDRKRTEFLQWHVAAVAEAIEAGVDVRGYFVWSLLDNFEWAYGYTKRFGIVYVDYDTQRRILKDSGLWYREFLASQRQ
jgi:beta-glucosidase